MLRPECAIVGQCCDEQQDKVVKPPRFGGCFAKATGSPEEAESCTTS